MQKSPLSQNTVSITKKIQKSPKYKLIYPKTIQRIVEFNFKKFKDPQKVEQETRKILHQIWGSYFKSKLRYKKILERFKAGIKEKGEKEAVLDLLKIHSSTAERIPVLGEFYSDIFNITGRPQKILDIGAGFNPLTLPWMNLDQAAVYLGSDINQGQINFLKNILTELNLKPKIKLKTKDIFVDDFPKADLAFLLKFLPVVSHQSKADYLKIFQKLKVKNIVTSYPNQSLCGKEKGMINFYKNQIIQFCAKEKFQFKKIPFKTETVYILTKP
ncbi:MAG: hypothetical protein GF347_04080 [Candidatus Moranbacteria bacterium]|nr:hypothetical protein [Candidatus Moranbacteria bacterium]